MTDPTNPLIVQSDQTLLLEVNHPLYIQARDALARFAELEKSPEYIHTYRITPLSLWNAAAAGIDADKIIADLKTYSKYALPTNLIREIQDTVGRFGRVRLIRAGDQLILEGDDSYLITEIAQQKAIQPYIENTLNAHQLQIDPSRRGHLKQALLKIGYPAEDLAGYITGEALPLSLRQKTVSGQPFNLRAYQQDAIDIFYAGGMARGGSGVIVLPCGAGKTIVGMGVMAALKNATLILTPSTVAVRQWISELIDKTTLTPDQIGEYTGQTKDIRPVTISTYQIMTYRRRKKDANPQFPHFKLFNARNWGLIIYDEVHLLPAPVFRITAELQARRRLGLTATLIREDNLEGDVFSLIGPKKYDVPWKDLEKQGWIAKAICHEIRIPLAEDARMTYALADKRQKFRVASENSRKVPVIKALMKKHTGENILIIGLYLDQLRALAEELDVPLITGKTKVSERETLYDAFRQEKEKVLVVSKVANFSIDLPDASVAIEISGSFGSRQEEAQRLGRILRPKQDERMAHFYTLVTRDTVDQTFANNRQRFLTEQGYQYEILYEEEAL